MMIKTKKTQNKKKRVYKEKEMKIYALWKAMPITFKELGPRKLRALGYAVDEELFMMLLEIRTEKQFAQIFGISPNTLDRWEKREEFKNLVKEISDMENIKKFKHDIDFNFTIQTMKKADPARVKLWYQLYEKWTKESRTGLSPELKKAVEALNKIIDE